MTTTITKEQIATEVNEISNAIVNIQSVSDLVHQYTCETLGIDPKDESLSERFETDEAFESLYYSTGAVLWADLTHRSAIQLGIFNNL